MNPQERAAQIGELLAQLTTLMSNVDRTEPPDQAAGPPHSVRVLFTVEEAAHQLGIGKTTAYALVRSGALQSVRIGRLRRIHADSIADYAARLVSNASAA